MLLLRYGDTTTTMVDGSSLHIVLKNTVALVSILKCSMYFVSHVSLLICKLQLSDLEDLKFGSKLSKNTTGFGASRDCIICCWLANECFVTVASNTDGLRSHHSIRNICVVVQILLGYCAVMSNSI
jgi:hypothetical protein